MRLINALTVVLALFAGAHAIRQMTAPSAGCRCAHVRQDPVIMRFGDEIIEGATLVSCDRWSDGR